MTKVASTGIVSVVMVMAMTGVYFSTRHPRSVKYPNGDLDIVVTDKNASDKVIERTAYNFSTTANSFNSTNRESEILRYKLLQDVDYLKRGKIKEVCAMLFLTKDLIPQST